MTVDTSRTFPRRSMTVRGHSRAGWTRRLGADTCKVTLTQVKK